MAWFLNVSFEKIGSCVPEGHRADSLFDEVSSWRGRKVGSDLRQWQSAPADPG